MLRPTVLACTVALLLLGAAGASPALLPAPRAPQGPAPANTHVHMVNVAFDPQNVTILVGETVDWDNHDVLTHTVTADDASFDSGNMSNGDTFQHTFTEPATVPYHCDFHGGMVGRIIVSDPSAMPDLVVAGIESADVLPAVLKRINVTVRNLGLNVAGATNVTLAYVYQGDEHLIGDRGVPPLGPGEAHTVQVEWLTLLKLGEFALRAHADSQDAVAESDEANNSGDGATTILLPVPGIDLLDPV